MYLRCASFFEHVILLKVVFTYILYTIDFSTTTKWKRKRLLQIKGTKVVYEGVTWTGSTPGFLSLSYRNAEIGDVAISISLLLLVFIQIFLEGPYYLFSISQ
jgi:hypothetical protein